MNTELQELMKKIEAIYNVKCEIAECGLLGKSLHVIRPDNSFCTFQMSDDLEQLEEMIVSFAQLKANH